MLDVVNYVCIFMLKWSNLFMNKVESGMFMDFVGLGFVIKGI